MRDDRQGVLPVFSSLYDAALSEALQASGTNYALAAQTLNDEANRLLLSGQFKQAASVLPSVELYISEAKRQIYAAICLTDGLPIDKDNFV